MENSNFFIEGRKTFFIAPDLSLFPEAPLSEYLSRGYETYIIHDDRICPIQKKVEIIVRLFKDSILFFYIDNNALDIDWKTYIKYLQDTYGDTVLIGVLYSKHLDEQEIIDMESYYLFDVGIQAGCIRLAYQKQKNFLLIEKVLYANQANGRRKHIRAVCNDASQVVFYHKGEQYSTKVSDISLSHFSCLFFTSLGFPIGTKLAKVQIVANGLRFYTDAVLALEREVDGKHLYVFLFVRPSDGEQGLEQDVYYRLTDKIYDIVTSKVTEYMQKAFAEYAMIAKQKGLR